MKHVTDPALLELYKKKYNVDGLFSTPNLPFRLLRFEKGELLAGLREDPPWLLLNLGGRVKLYAVQEGGDLAPMHLAANRFSCVNALELLGRKSPAVEAESTTYCLALPLPECRETLLGDVVFLRFLVDSLAGALALSNHQQLEMTNVEQRVLDYIRQRGGVNCVEDATYVLHCSRRQLQRVLRKLCESDTLVKIGRGMYVPRDNSNRGKEELDN